MEPTKLLLTGASGFIGSHILEHVLTNTDWSVVCICSWKHKGTPERIMTVLDGHPEWQSRVEIITHDLESPLTEWTKKRLGRINYVINAAAQSHVDRSITDPVPFVTNNVNVALTMLELAREIKPEVFIQVSTDEVYGVAPIGTTHPEWDPILPSNPYAASKACQEAIAISYWRTYGVPLIITNTMNNFGETQDPEKFISKTIRAVEKGEPVTVHGRPGLIGSRFYLHARNHADALLFLILKGSPLKYSEENLFPERYNIVGDEEVDNLTMARTIAEIMGKVLKYELVDFHSSRPGHDLRYGLDGTKIANLGWKPPVGFLESLKRYISWTLRNRFWI